MQIAYGVLISAFSPLNVTAIQRQLNGDRVTAVRNIQGLRRRILLERGSADRDGCYAAMQHVVFQAIKSALDSMPVVMMFSVNGARIDLFANVPSTIGRFDDQSNVMPIA